MYPKQALNAIAFCIENKYPIMLKGRPGCAKTSLVEQACKKMNVDLIVSHPVVSDPTDYKGLPYPTKDGKNATHLPFGDLLKLINAEKPTVFFLDDLGQSPMSVQASCMHLLLARYINGHKVSDHVTFVAATNRREDKAGVMGILEPVKSRFKTIIDIEINLDDWVDWAMLNNMPMELVSFIRWKPKLLDGFKATADLINTPSPRTIAHAGMIINQLKNTTLISDKEKELMLSEMIAGAAGQGFSVEYIAYSKVWNKLPKIEDILKDPKKHPLPSSDKLDVMYALTGYLASKTDKDNYAKIGDYMWRMTPEFQVYFLKYIHRLRPELIELTNPTTKKFTMRHVDLLSSLDR